MSSEATVTVQVNKKACEKHNTYNKINIQKCDALVFLVLFHFLKFLVILFLSFFYIPGNKDIVLELLSTMTKARDIAFVDKVRNNCKKLVEESKNINLFE